MSRRWVIMIGVLAILVLGLLLVLAPAMLVSWLPEPRIGTVYGVSLGFLAAFWLVVSVFTGRWNPLEYALGADKRYSTSKFQFFLWTAFVLHGYVALLTLRRMYGVLDGITIPANVLIAMGITTGTAIIAKAITTNQVSSNVETKPTAAGITDSPRAGQPQPKKSANLFQDDLGFLDLSKSQLVAWTFIALGAYMSAVHKTITDVLAVADPETIDWTTKGQLPDIDQALMVLMGLGQGAYLGRKLITSNASQIGSVVPQPVIPGKKVVISGQNLGGASSGGVIYINGKLLSTSVTWSDTSVDFTFPLTRLDSVAENELWQSGEQVTIKLAVHGNETSIPVTLPKVILNDLDLTAWERAQPLTVTGSGFGTDQPDRAVLINDEYFGAKTWEDMKVSIEIPPKFDPTTDLWRDVPLRILAYGSVVSNARTLSLRAKPHIARVDPPSAKKGNQINLQGDRFGQPGTVGHLSIGGKKVVVTSTDDQNIQVTLPTDGLTPGPGKIKLIVAGYESNEVDFTVTP